MKKSIISCLIILTIALIPQIATAQGILTYLSNLDQPSTGSNPVGSDSWYAALFRTGTNASGYDLNSIQLGMTDASGNPNSFTVMVYGAVQPPGASFMPGSSLGTLDGSLNPATSGIFTYTDASNLMLLPHTVYAIVLTAGTTVANGAYEWSYAGADSYNPSGGWADDGGSVYTSNNGSSWTPISGVNSQFAINATPVPEPSSEILLGLGGLAFLWRRRRL